MDGNGREEDLVIFYQRLAVLFVEAFAKFVYLLACEACLEPLQVHLLGGFWFRIKGPVLSGSGVVLLADVDQSSAVLTNCALRVSMLAE